MTTDIATLRGNLVSSVRTLIATGGKFIDDANQLVRSSGITDASLRVKTDLHALHEAMPEHQCSDIKQMFPDGNPFTPGENMLIAANRPKPESNALEPIFKTMGDTFKLVNKDLSLLDAPVQAHAEEAQIHGPINDKDPWSTYQSVKCS